VTRISPDTTAHDSAEPGRQLHRVDRVADQVDHKNEIGHAADDAESESLQHAAAVFADRGEKRRALDDAVLDRALEGRGLGDLAAQIVADRTQREADHERDAPAPGVEILLR
jgi:predicted GNAT family acetyltransferase